MIGVFEREENYKLFKTLGAKRYIYVYENGDLGLTTSGVNKKYAIPYLMKHFLPAPYNSDEYYELYKTAYNPKPGEEDKSTEAFKKIRSLNLDYEAILVNFAEDLVIPAGYSGKQTLTYIDEPKAMYLTDYLGKSTLCVEKSAIHMEPASYLFSISEQYKKFLAGIKEEYY